jgi:hypothetical protein
MTRSSSLEISYLRSGVSAERRWSVSKLRRSAETPLQSVEGSRRV